MHREISQMTRYKGLWYLEDGALHGSGADRAEAYTGDAAFRDVEVTAALTPVVGGAHQFMARVQGAGRCYALRLCEGDRLCLLKNEDGAYRCLAETAYPWRAGETHTLTLRAKGNRLTALSGGRELFSFADEDAPYLTGAVGVGVLKGHCAFHSLRVRGLA